MFEDLIGPEKKVAEPKTKQRKTAASGKGSVAKPPPPVDASPETPSRSSRSRKKNPKYM
jgi:hypothetical protein